MNVRIKLEAHFSFTWIWSRINELDEKFMIYSFKKQTPFPDDGILIVIILIN